jgi:hypothetical protein
MANRHVAAVVAAVLTAHGVAGAQATVGSGTSLSPVVLVDSNGKVAARPLNESTMLVSISGGVAAPASIRPVHGPDGRTASGLATWNAGGSVLFTSADCTTGAHVYSSSHAAARATSQVQSRAGIVLYVGAIGPTVTVSVQSVLYDTGCGPLVIHQNGLVPVVTTVNLTTVYPPPLSFQ